MRIFKSSVERADDHFNHGRFEKAAELYVKAGRFDQAAEVYSRNLRDVDRAAEAYEMGGKPLEAGRLFEAAERYRDAIARYQSAGAYRRAAEASLKNRQALRAAGFFEQAEMFERAAECYLDDGNVDGALRALEKETDELRRRRQERGDPMLDQRLRLLDLQRSELMQRIGRNAEAAALLDQHGKTQKAASIYEQAGDYEAAIEAFLRVHREDEALRLVEEHPDVRAELRAEVLLNASHFHEAATIFERLEKFDAAAAAYQSAGDLAHAAALWEKAGSYSKAADLFTRVERFYDAARCFARSGGHRLAAESFIRSGSPSKAADAYLSADMALRAAEMYLEADDELSALQALQDLEPDHPDYIEACLLLVPLLLDQGLEEAAGDRLMAIKEARDKSGHQIVRYKALYCQARYLEAKGRFEAAEACYGKVMAAKADYRDADRRARDMRGRIDASTSLEGLAEQEITGVTRTLEAESHRTQRIALKESAASTRTRSMPVESIDGEPSDVEPSDAESSDAESSDAESSDRFDAVAEDVDPAAGEDDRDAGEESGKAAAASLDETSGGRISGDKTSGGLEPMAFEEDPADLTGPIPLTDSSSVDLPVILDEKLEPWWEGAHFWRVIHRESDEPRFMVSFPLALVGDRVSVFEQIVRQLKVLRHDAVLQLEATETVSDKVLLFYETLEGETLESALRGGRRFAPREALRLVVQLCEALIRAHKLGLTHQWLSPHTVLVDREGRCKMAGLGLREFLLAGEDRTRLAYLSPEVAEDGMVGPSSDVYSLGMLAVTLLEAQLPTGKHDSYDSDQVKWPESVQEEVPSSLRTFLLRCLEKMPLDRPTTAEVAAALAGIGFLPGQLLDERYEIIEEIGRGGMSRVYSAVDRDLGDDVAIKTVLTPALGRTEDEERLLREVQISRRITHTNVVRVHDLGRFPGGIFVIMELLDGPGLDEVILAEAPLERPRVKRLVMEIASALGEAHRLSIVHRDLKPGNVILVEGRVKVLDFGIARATDDAASHLTRTGEVVGSPLYMSPEQIQGQQLDGRCDLYSLGVITYTLLTGREPFAADSPTAVVLKHLNEPPPDIRQLVPDLPQEWIDVIDRLLAKQPDERFPDAKALLDAMGDLPV